MKLYHGSYMEVKEPHILKKTRNLDFGNGFYTTSDLEQAKSWAFRQAKNKHGVPIVSVYEIDPVDLELLRVQKFERPGLSWLRYVAKYRKGYEEEDFDIVMGPVANDRTMPTLILYFDGYLTADETIRRLLPQKLKDQIVFKTEHALSKLHWIERYEYEAKD